MQLIRIKTAALEIKSSASSWAANSAENKYFTPASDAGLFGRLKF